MKNTTIIDSFYSTGLARFIFLFFSMTLFFTSCGDDDSVLRSQEFVYQVHNGQIVPSAPYTGSHNSTLRANLRLDELENGNTMITVELGNTINGETYHIHAHDSADPATTPNGTPYMESPNANIFAKAIQGNGATISISQETTSSLDDLITSYNGFFVVHDPLQDINTADISTFLVVGSFARAQTLKDYAFRTFNYEFNRGQLAQEFTYTGDHAESLGASITIEELADNRSRVIVNILNTMNGEVYHTHAHDSADPATTPNNTPYLESPNAAVFVSSITGNGSTTSKALISSKTYEELTTSYDGFFVIHDPLQTVSTKDPSTFVILGTFAR